MKADKVICASGFFEPFHVGHVEYLERAKSLGTFLIVIVNNDEQVRRSNKENIFMTCEERCTLLSALQCVDMVVPSIDKDDSVCHTLSVVTPKPHIFCNGGDKYNYDVPELSICQKLGIELKDGLGWKIR